MEKISAQKGFSTASNIIYAYSKAYNDRYHM